MSLKARDFFNIYWMHPIPGVYISFEESTEAAEPPEPNQVPTHSVEVLVDVCGMQRQLSGSMAVSWSEAEFAKHTSADFTNIVNNAISDKLLPYVKIVGSVTIAKL
jgi:hypothetical protein